MTLRPHTQSSILCFVCQDPLRELTQPGGAASCRLGALTYVCHKAILTSTLTFLFHRHHHNHHHHHHYYHYPYHG